MIDDEELPLKEWHVPAVVGRVPTAAWLVGALLLSIAGWLAFYS